MTRGLRWRVLILQVGLIGILSFVAGFLFWANSFTHSQVQDQLAAQKITFPTVGSHGFDAQTLGASQYAEISQFAGQNLTNGPQAQAYANDYINVHLQGVANGQTYSQVSGALIAEQSKTTPDPKVVATLTGQRTTLFMGETLRGLLLNAYGWWQVGQYAFYAAIGLVVAAGAVFVALAFELVRWTQTARQTAPKPVRVTGAVPSAS
jgi:hypothetical protein